MNLWQNISIEGKIVRNEAPEKSAKNKQLWYKQHVCQQRIHLNNLMYVVPEEILMI